MSVMASNGYSYSYFATESTSKWIDLGTSVELLATPEQAIKQELCFASNVWLLDQKKINLPLFLMIAYSQDFSTQEISTTCDIAYRRIIIPKKTWIGERLDIGCGAYWDNQTYFNVYAKHDVLIDFDISAVKIKIYNQTIIKVPIGGMLDVKNKATVEFVNILFARVNIFVTQINPLRKGFWEQPTSRIGLSFEM
jgi:hypothetical protein